jgi:hypothetical protein
MIMRGVVHNTGFFAMYNHDVSAVTMLLEEGLTPHIIVDPSPSSSSNVREISLPRLALDAFVFPGTATSHVARRVTVVSPSSSSL